MDNLHRFVNYLLDPEAENIDHSNPLWVLGAEYSPVPDDESQLQGNGESSYLSQIKRASSPQFDVQQLTSKISNYFIRPQTGPSQHMQPEDFRTIKCVWPSDFVDKIEERLWMTYRTNFPVIPRVTDGPASISVSSLLRGQINDKDGFTSDVGWGCMVRTGQTLLANTLASMRHLRMGSDEEKKVVSWFSDDPRAPFSIHRFVQQGYIACGKYPGEWFGPSAAARCIQILCSEFEESNLRVYIAGDAGDIYEDSLLQVAKGLDGAGDFKPTLILLGIRLGIEKINPIYHNALKFCLQVPQGVGIAGGRPSSSHYFFGFQESNLFYLDPHFPRKALPYRTNYASYTKDEIDSVHTRRVRNISLDVVDPSMLIGFLIRDKDDWIDWKDRIEQFSGKKFIHLSRSEPVFGQGHSMNMDDYVDLGYTSRKRATPIDASGNESEDFEHVNLEDVEDDHGVREIETDNEEESEDVGDDL
ncbi:hypothetical protein V1511DRAFT_463330 [Dipodascopsis uninucleata]